MHDGSWTTTWGDGAAGSATGTVDGSGPGTASPAGTLERSWVASSVRVGTARVSLNALTHGAYGELVASVTADEVHDAIRAGERSDAPRDDRSMRDLAILIAAKAATLDAIGTGRPNDATIRFDDDDAPEVVLGGVLAEQAGDASTTLRIIERADEISAIVAIVATAPLPG